MTGMIGSIDDDPYVKLCLTYWPFQLPWYLQTLMYFLNSKLNLFYQMTMYRYFFIMCILSIYKILLEHSHFCWNPHFSWNLELDNIMCPFIRWRSVWKKIIFLRFEQAIYVYWMTAMKGSSFRQAVRSSPSLSQSSFIPSIFCELLLDDIWINTDS